MDNDGSQYLHPDILNNIAKSEIEGGVFVDKMEDGDYLVETQNTFYTLTKKDGGFLIQGHSKYCPVPTPVNIHGSTWGGSMIKSKFIGRCMYLEFSIPDTDWGAITTSEIKDITKL